jgi:hypothetical protein
MTTISDMKPLTGNKPASPPGTTKHDFYEFMSAIQTAISNEYRLILRRAKEDPGTAGDQVEESWSRLLRGWLPANYPIVTKGRLRSQTDLRVLNYY